MQRLKKKLSVKEKINLSFQFLPSFKNPEIRLLNQWCEANEKNDNEQILWSAQVDEAFSKINWAALKKGETKVKDTINILRFFSNHQKNIEAFQAFCSLLMPLKTGTWLESANDYTAYGWTIHTNTALNSLSPMEGSNPIFSQLLHWSLEQNEPNFAIIKKELNASYTEIELQLQANTLSIQLQKCDSLFKTFGYTWLGDSFKKILEHHGIKQIDLLLAYTDEGLFKIGVKIKQPSRILMLFMAALSKQHQDTKLALLEGVLDVKKADCLSYCMYSQFWKTEFYYRFGKA